MAGTVALAGIGGFSLFDNKDANKNKSEDNEIEVVALDDFENAPYVDFMGREHPDKYGNLARLNELKPDILAILVAVEGFADKTYLDGEGVETIGIGTTNWIDENGNTRKVKKGENITYDEAVVQQWRYIEKSLYGVLGDKLGRSCSDRELITAVGASYCWGRAGLLESDFYKALKDGADNNKLERLITRFRKQKGVLKRGYLLACCLNGNWTRDDVLKLPITYSEEHKQYLGCSIYSNSIQELANCKKGRDGEYNLIIDKDNCSTLYTDKATADTVFNKMVNSVVASKKAYKTVGDIINGACAKDTVNSNVNLDFNTMKKITDGR